MMNKFYALALSAVLGAGAFAMSGNSASAGAIPAYGGTGVANGGSELLQDVAMRGKDKWKWDRKRHGDRYRNRRNGYSNYYGGYYYSEPWWTLSVPLAVYDDNDGDWSEDHIQWCSERYRSYNPDDNSWVSYSGEVRECNSPF